MSAAADLRCADFGAALVRPLADRSDRSFSRGGAMAGGFFSSGQAGGRPAARGSEREGEGEEEKEEKICNLGQRDSLLFAFP